MFKNLLQFEVFYQFKQRAFPLFALLFLALGYFVGGQGYAQSGVNFNSVYQVYYYTSIFTLGSVFIIMFFAISGALRDKQHQMEGLVFSTSITKSHYFWSKFLGTFLFSVFAFSPFILGYFLGISFSNLDPERVGDFQVIAYLQPFLYIVVPNIFICTVIVFSVSALTKNSTATYVSAVFIYMLYFVSSIYLNSPIMAQAVPSSPESMMMAALADPFGIAAFMEQTQYWTAAQKNTQLVSLSGLFLANRLIWMTVALGLIGVTYRMFKFTKNKAKLKKVNIKNEVTYERTPYHHLNTVHNLKSQFVAYRALVKLELKHVFKSLPFIAIMLIWLFMVFSELYARIVQGEDYGVRVYPFTSELIAILVQPISTFSLILILYYAADIIWRERSLKFNYIVDATPVSNPVFFLSKFSTLIILPLLLISTGVMMSLAFQVALGYFEFDWKVYAAAFYHYGLPIFIFCMIAFFVNTLVKNKYVGMGVFGLVTVLSLKANLLGLEHPLTSLGFMPNVAYSNMTGFYNGTKLFNHLALYWMAFGLILIVLAFKLWHRGVVSKLTIKLKQITHGTTRVEKALIFTLMLLFLGAGGLVYYNMNVVSSYTTYEDKLAFSETYEKQYKTYDILEQLYVISRHTQVDLYPKQGKYHIEANYILKHRGTQPISKLMITERVPLELITIEGAILETHDTRHGVYIYQFEEAIAPNDSVNLQFTINYELKGYEEDLSLAENGTYLRYKDFEPIWGYRNSYEIQDPIERKKRGLAKRLEAPTIDEHIALEDLKYEKHVFETIVSTDANQIALSSGDLVKSWTENERQYYHYKANDKLLPSLAYISGDYATKSANYNGIAIEQYYHANHDSNIERIEASAQTALAYCEANFGAYPFSHVRIAEVPSYWRFGGFAHPGLISMVEDNLYFYDMQDETTFDLVAKRTVHEVAHQWWGHTLSAKPVAGGALFVEGFAKYTEAVVLEKMYGKRAVYTLSENVRQRYFSRRAYDGNVEPPVYKVEGQSYISYGKALTVMLALRDLIGEEQVNQILKTLTDRYRDKPTFEANSIEFLDDLYKVTPIAYHTLIDDWFKRVIIYNLEIEDSSYKVLPNGTYELTTIVNAKRFETLADGTEQEITMNEPIKIGVFTTHPSEVSTDKSILHYQSHHISTGITEIKMIVNEKPRYVAIDPYGTRNDENLVDNVKFID